MSRVIVVNFVSLDGVMESPLSAGEDGDRAGWVEPYADETVSRTMSEATVSAGGMLLGRRTYEIFATVWPHADATEPAVAAMNRMPKYVASTSLRPTDTRWAGTVVLGTDLPAQVSELKRHSDLVVFGSATLVQTLIEHDLVDEFRLLVFPLVLGTGRRMFPAGTPPTTLRLVSVRSSESGVLITTYRPATAGCKA